MRRVAIAYARVSTEDQARRGYSLPEQLAACRQRARTLADAEGAHVEVLEFADHTSGAIVEGREQLEAALAVVRRGAADWFICLHPDRFARDLFGQLRIYDEIRRHGTRVEFVQAQFAESPEGRLFFQLAGAIAEYERAKIRERSMRGRIGKLKAGKIASRVDPYGFRWDAEADRPVPVPEEIEWVRRMFEWAAGVGVPERLNPHQIALRLDQLGAPSKRGGRWHRTTVINILRHPIYAGKVVLNRWDFSGVAIWRGVPRERRQKNGDKPIMVTAKKKPSSEWYAVEIEPVVDPALWAAVQRYISDAKRTAQPAVHLLAGLMYCGLCGSPVRALHSRGGRYYLRCRDRYPRVAGYADWDKRTPCTMPHIRYEPVERGVWEQVRAWFRDPSLFEEAVHRLTAKAREAAGDHESQIRRLRAAVEEKKAAQGRILHLVERGLIDLATAEARLVPLKQQIDALEDELRQIESRAAHIPSQEDISAVVASVEALREEISVALDELSEDEKRELVRRLVGRVIVYPDGTWRVEPRI